MVSIRKPRSRRLTTVVFACLLVSGQAALAAHVYEHDLAAVPSDCTVCAVSHAFKDVLVSSADAPICTVVHENRPINSDAVVVIPPRGPYRARAPPTPIS